LILKIKKVGVRLRYVICYFPVSAVVSMQNISNQETGAENGAEIDDKLLFSVNCNDIINRKGSGKKAYYFIYIDHN